MNNNLEDNVIHVHGDTDSTSGTRSCDTFQEGWKDSGTTFDYGFESRPRTIFISNRSRVLTELLVCGL